MPALYPSSVKPSPNRPRIVANCPVCDGTSSNLIRTLQDHYSSELFELHACLNCGGKFLKDPPPQEEIAKYYGNFLGEVMWKKSNSVFSLLNRVSLYRDFGIFKKILKLGDAVLDLGAGSGAAASYLYDRGYKVESRDMYPESSWVHPNIPFRSVNLNGGHLSAEELLCGGRVPEVIYLRHVFEHLYSPRKVLELAYEVGVPYVLLIVPNVDSPLTKLFGHNWYYWDPPRHLSFFSQSSLREIGRRARYETVMEKCYGIDEIVTSMFRRSLLKFNHSHPEIEPSEAGRMALSKLLEPKGVLASISSAISAPFGSTVCWWLGKRV